MCLLLVYVALDFVAISFAQQPISIDDGDPSIVYEPTGAWLSAPVFGAQLYNNSATFSETPGATATWKFKGCTHVEYWGVIGGQGSCQVTIDDSNESEIVASTDASESVAMLYQRSDLEPEREHTLVIRILSASQDSMYVVDRFMYTPITATTKSPSSTGTKAPGGDGTRSSSASFEHGEDWTSSSPPTQSLLTTTLCNDCRLDPTDTDGNSRPSWGVIIGAIGGALCVVVLFGVALYFWCRHRKPRDTTLQDHHQHEQQTLVQPRPQDRPLVVPYPPQQESFDQPDIEQRATATQSPRPMSETMSFVHPGITPLPSWRKQSEYSLRPPRLHPAQASRLGMAITNGEGGNPAGRVTSPTSPLLGLQRRPTEDSVPDVGAWLGVDR